MDRNNKEERKKRVQIIKKIIIVLIIVLFLLPTILCIILFAKYNKLSDELDRVRQLKIERILVAGKKASEANMIGAMVSFAKGEVSKREVLRLEEQEKLIENAKGRVYLTFDDGPSANTDDILAILRKNDIKATFFVVGKTDGKSLERYRKIVSEGHTIALHSYTHDFSQIYASLDNFKKDYYAISDLIYNTTGVRSRFYRFPGGSSNSVSKIDMNLPVKFLKEEGIEYFDWNVMSGDAVRIPPSAKELYNNVITGIHGTENSIVLMHDLPEKKSTVEALSEIIKKLKEENYLMLPIDNSTPIVHHKIRKFS